MVIESVLTVGVVHAVKVRTTLGLLTVGDLVKAVVCGRISDALVLHILYHNLLTLHLDHANANRVVTL